jgi:adenosine/AMP kinase
MEFEIVEFKKKEEQNIIIGQTHFIKTVEDVYEAMVTAVPNIKFGFAFCEASGPRLIRKCGTDTELIDTAVENAKNIGAGHSFVLILGNVFPVNVLKRLQNVQEIVQIFAATANPTKVLIAKDGDMRAILGIFDGYSPLGIETEKEIKKRKEFLRTIGYKK